MEKNNHIVSHLQIAIIGFLLANAFFPGFGINIILKNAERDAWMVPLIAVILGVIPILLITYIMSYETDKNLFEKNKILFGNIWGQVINLIMSASIFIMLATVIWGTAFSTQYTYLAEVPFWFQCTAFTVVAIYACIKGIETISRVSELLLVLAIVFIFIIVASLFSQTNIEYIKPMLKEGAKPILQESVRFISYAFLPLITLLVIPKNNIKQSKKLNKFLISSFLLGVSFMTVVFYTIVSVLTVGIATNYRYPELYVQRKIQIAEFFQGIENFLTLHWYVNLFIMIAMCIYFLSNYSKDIFNIKKEKTLNISIFIIGLLGIITSNYMFKNGIAALSFMEKQFPYFIGIPLFLIIIIISVLIFFKKSEALD